MPPPNSSAQRVQRRRDKLRAAGLRPIQIWVPDTRAIGFAEECARQARLVRSNDGDDTHDAAWADTSDTSGWSA